VFAPERRSEALRERSALPKEAFTQFFGRRENAVMEETAPAADVHISLLGGFRSQSADGPSKIIGGCVKPKRW
jgi:hypothetical protein